MQGVFLGFWAQEATLVAALSITDGNDVPTDPATPPTFRVYDGQQLMANSTGNLTKLDTGNITGATTANPIVITSANHGLQTGNIVTITNVGGNTAANGTFVVTKIDSNTFSIAAAGNGAYTAGGTWHTTGLYQLSLPLTGANGFVAGSTYEVLVNWTISNVNYARMHTVTVV